MPALSRDLDAVNFGGVLKPCLKGTSVQGMQGQALHYKFDA